MKEVPAEATVKTWLLFLRYGTRLRTEIDCLLAGTMWRHFELFSKTENISKLPLVLSWRRRQLRTTSHLGQASISIRSLNTFKHKDTNYRILRMEFLDVHISNPMFRNKRIRTSIVMLSMIRSLILFFIFMFEWSAKENSSFLPTSTNNAC